MFQKVQCLSVDLFSNVSQIQNGRPYANGDETILTALPLYHIFALSVNFLAFITLGGRMDLLLPKPIPIKNTVKEAFKKYKITVMTELIRFAML